MQCLCLEGGQGDRRCRVPRRRLGHHPRHQRRIDRLELPADEHSLAGGGNGHHAPGGRHPQHPPHGGLEQRFLAEQLDQMLGERGPAHRPEAGPGAARKDDGDQLGGGARGDSHAGGDLRHGRGRAGCSVLSRL